MLMIARGSGTAKQAPQNRSEHPRRMEKNMKAAERGPFFGVRTRRTLQVFDMRLLPRQSALLRGLRMGLR